MGNARMVSNPEAKTCPHTASPLTYTKTCPHTTSPFKPPIEASKFPQSLRNTCPLFNLPLKLQKAAPFQDHPTRQWNFNLNIWGNLPTVLAPFGRSLYIYPSIHPSIHISLSIHPSFLPIHPSIYLSVYPAIQLSQVFTQLPPPFCRRLGKVFMSIYHPSIYLSIDRLIHPSIHPCIYLSIYRSILLPSIHLSISSLHRTSFIFLSIFHPSIHLSSQVFIELPLAGNPSITPATYLPLSLYLSMCHSIYPSIFFPLSVAIVPN